MWKIVGKSVFPIVTFLNSETALTQQLRVSFTLYSPLFVYLQLLLQTVYVLKRRFPVPLHKKGEDPRPLKAKHYVYELVEDTSVKKQPSLDVVLTSYIDGLGNPGDTVTVSQNYGYINLLLPKLAVYATPENIEKYKDYVHKEDVVKYSTPQANIVSTFSDTYIILISCDFLLRLQKC